MQLEFGGRRFAVAAGEMCIGSDPALELCLPGEGVAARHATVRRAVGGPLVVQATAGSAIKVNGAVVGTDPTPLFHGDRLAIGSHEILIVDPERGGVTQVFARRDDSARGGPERPAAAGSRLVSLNDGREYHVDVVPFLLGRDASAQIVVSSPDASRQHAEIVSRPDGDVLVDLSANGTYLNGQRVNGRQALKALDVVRIGSEEFRYYPGQAGGDPPRGAEFRLSDTLIGLPKSGAEPVVPPLPPKPLAALLVKAGGLRGERIAVRSAVVNIGRADYNDIRLPDPSVSSSHAKLQLKEGVWLLSDLGSTNGTVVDGERVDDETPLSPGATVKLGDVSLAFEPRDEGPVKQARTSVLAKPVAVETVDPPPAPLVERPRPPRPKTVADVVPQEGGGNQWWLGLAVVALLGALAALVYLV